MSNFAMMVFSFYRHSPFRQHKTKDKHEIDRMTMTMVSIDLLFWFCRYLTRELI